jgi:hypothetical protein
MNLTFAPALSREITTNFGGIFNELPRPPRMSYYISLPNLAIWYVGCLFVSAFWLLFAAIWLALVTVIWSVQIAVWVTGLIPAIIVAVVITRRQRMA